GVTTRSSGGPRWRKWLACTVVVFSGRWRLLQIHRRRFELPGRESSSDSSSPLSAMESGGYQRSALPFGIPMFFGKKVYECGKEWFAFVGGLSGLELRRTRFFVGVCSGGVKMEAVKSRR
ncbi:unnamed protein product, partial [Brassica rapa subsp. trilocularis]